MSKNSWNVIPCKKEKISPCCFHINGLSGYHTVDAHHSTSLTSDIKYCLTRIPPKKEGRKEARKEGRREKEEKKERGREGGGQADRLASLVV